MVLLGDCTQVANVKYREGGATPKSHKQSMFLAATFINISQPNTFSFCFTYTLKRRKSVAGASFLRGVPSLRAASVLFAFFAIYTTSEIMLKSRIPEKSEREREFVKVRIVSFHYPYVRLSVRTATYVVRLSVCLCVSLVRNSRVARTVSVSVLRTDSARARSQAALDVSFDTLHLLNLTSQVETQ